MENLKLSFAGHEIAWNDLPDNSKAALAVLGFSTKIKNSIAGVKAGILGTAKEPWTQEQIDETAKEYGIEPLRDGQPVEPFVKAICEAIQADMFQSIVNGIDASTRRGGTRLSDDEKLRRAIEIEFLENAAKAKGKALPKRSKPDEKEAFEQFLSKARENEKFSAAVEKEFAKRKGAKALDLEELF
jgi:hypothetical protein